MKKIAFIEMNFPFVTTFMASEMLSIKRRGVPIVILPINLNSFDNVQDIYHDLKEDLHYPPFLNHKVLWAFFYFLVTRPGSLLPVLFEVLLNTRRPLKYVVQTWAILPKSIYCAWYAQKNDIDHIHGNWAHYPTTIAYIIKKLTGISFSFSSHAGADIYRNHDMLDKKIKDSEFSFTCVRGNKEFMEKLYSLNLNNKVHILYHGVDLNKFNQRSIEISREIKPPYTILSVGNLHEAKGFQYMIEAVSILKKKFPVKYVIVGKGYHHDVLSKKIEQLGLTEEIELKGQILHKDLLEIYQSVDVFVMPSIELANGGRDGIPNVVIEAMGMGVPVVGSIAAGIPEAVVDGKTGVLAKQKDPEKLAMGVERILTDTSLRLEVIQGAREFVSEYFDRDKNQEKLFNVFKEKVL